MTIEQKLTDVVEASNRLTDVVDRKMSIIDQQVNNKCQELDNWKSNLKAEQIDAAKLKKQIIDLTGLSTDKYYPVWWQFNDNESNASQLVISRGYSRDTSLYPFGNNIYHNAALFLELEGNGNPWHGDANYLNIKRIQQRYRNTVKSIKFGMTTIMRRVNGQYPLWHGLKSGDITECQGYSGCYLRGGLSYLAYHNLNQDIRYSRLDSEVEIYQAIHPTHNNTGAEGKWMVKSFDITSPVLGGEYKDGTSAWTEKNTTVDANGFIKKASPVVKLFGDGRCELNNESEGVTTKRLSEGVYLLSGALGFHSDNGWHIEVPQNENKQPLIWVDYEIQSNGDIKVKTFHRTYPNSPEFAQNNKEGYKDGNPIDIPSGRWLDLRIEMFAKEPVYIPIENEKNNAGLFYELDNTPHQSQE